jgi:hypothetical protein
MDGNTPIFACGTEPGVHTIEMYGDFKPIKLPAEFLPDDATELHLTSSGGKKFKITVSDDGALSAVEATA